MTKPFSQVVILCLTLAAESLPAAQEIFDFGPAENGDSRIEIWPRDRTREPVSRLLYGKFTEHLWWNVYNGLWAQVLRNPSFESWQLMGEGWKRIPDIFGRMGLTGRFPGLRVPTSAGGDIAPWWLPWGRAQVKYAVAGGAFNSQHCQFLSARSVDGGAGIEQPIYLPLHREGDYRLVFFAKGDARLRISVQSPVGELASAAAQVESRNWQRRPLSLRIDRRGVVSDTPLLFRVELAEPGEIWLDQITLFPEDSLEGFDPDIVRMLRESKLPLLRFPGGNFVSGYHWEDGIGGIERRPTRRNSAWGDFEPNHVGTDEYLTLCRLVGCEPLICVNAGDGSAQEAAGWVEYANGSTATKYGALRAKNGHPEPYRVKFWEIGNELYGKWQIGHCTAEEYARRYAAFHKEMSAVDPTLLFLAIGQTEEWSAPLVRANGSAVRSLAVHELPGGAIPAEAPPREVFEELMAYPFAFRTKLLGLAALMKGAGLKPRIALTEAQIFTNKPTLPNNSGLAEALWLAGIIHMAIREGDLVELITHSALVNHAGGLRKQKEIVYANPVHYASLLYGTGSGEFPARVKVRSPYYESPGRHLPGTRGEKAPLLDPVALVNRAGNELTLIVLNRNATEEISAVVFLHDFPAAPSVKTRVLTGADYRAQNSLENPRAVRLVAGEMRQAHGTLTCRFPPHSLVELVFRRAFRY